MLYACLYIICLVFRYTSWSFYAIFGTNLLTSRHSASSLFSAIFVFQKSYTGNIFRMGRNQNQSPRISPKLPENRRGGRVGPRGPHTLSTLACRISEKTGPVYPRTGERRSLPDGPARWGASARREPRHRTTTFDWVCAQSPWRRVWPRSTKCGRGWRGRREHGAGRRPDLNWRSHALLLLL
jgi:hypothetical protein